LKPTAEAAVAITILRIIMMVQVFRSWVLDGKEVLCKANWTDGSSYASQRENNHQKNGKTVQIRGAVPTALNDIVASAPLPIEATSAWPLRRGVSALTRGGKGGPS
jgi:hypothetical protein